MISAREAMRAASQNREPEPEIVEAVKTRIDMAVRAVSATGQDRMKVHLSKEELPTRARLLLTEELMALDYDVTINSNDEGDGWELDIDWSSPDC